MSNSEEGKSSKSDTSSAAAPTDQTNIHIYPDWAAMQAYYGPRVGIPPYYNAAVASGHAPHTYMWGPPQPLMPPYGTPYAAIYSQGGVYAHPAVPISTMPQGVETTLKSSGNSDQGLTKNLKGFHGLAMSAENGNGNAEGGDCKKSQSVETEGSSDGSNGSSATGRKRSREVTPTAGGDMKTETRASSCIADKVNASSDKIMATEGVPASVPEKAVAPVISPRMSANLELGKAPGVGIAKTIATGVPQPCAALPAENWLQSERELKRERRKQSNRESARRSRLRKQAETEELALKVESLTAENVALKSEINQLAEKSEKLRHENAAMTETLGSARSGGTESVLLSKNEPSATTTDTCTENLLSRVNNSASTDGNTEENGDLCDRNPNSNTKLRQLLDRSPRTDAVAAG